jgi:cystathionine beta-lyase family protein involved in aluminum resistance
MKQDFFNFDPKIEAASQEAMRLCAPSFARIDEIAEYNSRKVLAAFIANKVSETHFAGSTGYGYGDRGREVLDAVFAQALGATDALVRHNFVSGTHALATALFGVLRPGDTVLACTGKPYDTLDEIIGLRGSGNGSLKDFGVNYQQLDLLPDGTVDLEGLGKALKTPVKVAYIQRSRGYSLRPSLSVDSITAIVKAVRQVSPKTIVMVDNCYGEFTQITEPTQVGADLIIGSLIKNAGGGMAETGGYIAGRHDLIELAAYRLTSPGMGREVGATLNQNRAMFKGLFFAPHITAQALKTAVFSAAFFGLLGFKVTPRYDEPRTDLIETIELGSEEALITFCQGLQAGSPVDSFALPEPWDMPGYDSRVIMAAGAFILGASIELSADAPLRPPYAVWMQGGLTIETGKAGVMLAAQAMLEKGYLK